MAPRVFISSRERELEPEREIAARAVRALGMDPWRLEVDGAPQFNVNANDAFLQGVEQADLVVLLLWKEFSEPVRKEFDRARTEGKEVLCLIKEIRKDWNEKRQKKLAEFIRVVRNSGCTTTNFRSLSDLRKRLIQGLAICFQKKLQSPFQAAGKEKLFRTGTKLIEESKKRVILVARTPIPIVGTRPYDGSRQAFAFEEDQLRLFEKLIEEAECGNKRSFRCVSSLHAMSSTLLEHEDTCPNLRTQVRERVHKFYAKSSTKGSKFELRWIRKGDHRPLTFLVADDNFLIWLNDGEQDVWITWPSERISRALDVLSRDISEPIHLRKIDAELGLVESNA